MRKFLTSTCFLLSVMPLYNSNTQCLQTYRLFTLAAAKLDRTQQKAVFLRLVGLLQAAVTDIDPTLLEIDTIRLLARGVCLAAHMVSCAVHSCEQSHEIFSLWLCFSFFPC